MAPVKVASMDELDDLIKEIEAKISYVNSKRLNEKDRDEIKRFKSKLDFLVLFGQTKYADEDQRITDNLRIDEEWGAYVDELNRLLKIAKDVKERILTEGLASAK